VLCAPPPPPHTHTHKRTDTQTTTPCPGAYVRVEPLGGDLDERAPADRLQEAIEGPHGGEAGKVIKQRKEDGRRRRPNQAHEEERAATEVVHRDAVRHLAKRVHAVPDTGSHRC
jgi:hypothetical protein